MSQSGLSLEHLDMHNRAKSDDIVVQKGGDTQSNDSWKSLKKFYNALSQKIEIFDPLDRPING